MERERERGKKRPSFLILPPREEEEEEKGEEDATSLFALLYTVQECTYVLAVYATELARE